jgi:nitrogen fixation/metabolism regulation signal transduction histidine kinase
VRILRQYRFGATGMTGWVTTAFALILLGFTLLAVLSAHELAVSASASLASPHKEPPNE